MKPNALTKGFRIAGKTFANALRKHLPDAVFGSSQQSARARAVLAKTAEQTSVQLTAASKAFLKGATIKDAVVKGQVQASKAVGIEFGGPNTALVNKLTKEIAIDLARASASPRASLANTLRRATAYAKQNEGITTALENVNKGISEVLLKEALTETTYKRTVARMMDDLGLEDGDKVLFMSGYRMDAEAYAELLTRTRTLEAINEAKAEELKDNGYEYIKTTEHGGVDERDICILLQGKVWALDPDNDLGLPVLPEEYGLPPWHPNCGHGFGAWQPKFETEASIKEAIAAHEEDEAELEKWEGRISQPKGA